MTKESGIVRSPIITDEIKNFRPSEKEQAVVTDVFGKFSLAMDERNRSYKFLNDRTIVQYIEDSVYSYLANEDLREGIEDWQARVYDRFTNNKVTAFLGRATRQLPFPEFKARGDEDVKRAKILNDLYRYSEDVDNYEDNMMYILEEALVKGTAVVYEGMRIEGGKRRYVRGAGDKMKVIEKDYSETKLYTQLVPLEEYYPASVRNKRVQENPYCFWRNQIPYEQFLAEYAEMYAAARFVVPFSPARTDEDTPFYALNISSDVQVGNVEIIRFFDKNRDQFVIIANGKWLNPLETEVTIEDISPLPFNHKMLPFWAVKAEIRGDWFYGGSIPDRLLPMQSVLNVLTNMLLDQSFMTIFPPMLTSGFDSIEDDYLRPGRRTPVDTQGLPINQSFMKLDLGTPGGWHQFILDYTRNVMAESSLDQVSSGVAGGGDRTTAKEITRAAEGVESVLGLFDRLRNNALKDKAYLRAANILQFWTDPKTPFMVGIIGEDAVERTSKAFNTFEIDGITLSGGKRGTHIIEIVKSDSQRPTNETLEARAMIAKADTGKNVEYSVITPKYIRNIRFDVTMQLNQRNDETKEIEKALQLEKVRVYKSFFPNMVNDAELLAQTCEVMGDDPTKIISESVLNPQPQGQNPEEAQMMSQQPGTNVANNMVRGMSSGGGMSPQAITQMLG